MVAPAFTVNVDALMVVAFSELLKVVLTVVLVPTPVAPFAGTVVVTLSGAAALIVMLRSLDQEDVTAPWAPRWLIVLFRWSHSKERFARHRSRSPKRSYLKYRDQK